MSGFEATTPNHVAKLLRDRWNYLQNCILEAQDQETKKRKELTDLIALGQTWQEEVEQLEEALNGLVPRCITCKQPIQETSIIVRE